MATLQYDPKKKHGQHTAEQSLQHSFGTNHAAKQTHWLVADGLIHP